MTLPNLTNDLNTDILEATFAAILGVLLYTLFTHPKYQKKRLPKIRLGKVQILPNLRIRLKSGTVRLHHWIILSAILSFINHVAKGLDNLIFIKLFALGGIIQGLSFRDRFKIFWEKPVRKLSYYPTVSVVIPAHNEENFIARTLASLKKQDYAGKFEIIVVDNACTDKTAQIARKYGAKVVFEARKGLEFARQTGFEAAKYGLIASTDADIILPKNWLTRLSTQLILDKKTVAVSGWFKLNRGPKIPRIGINYLSIPAIFIYSKVFNKKLLLDPNFMVKSNAFFQVDGFRNLPAMLEDLQLAQKLTKVGLVKMNYSSHFSVVSSPRRWKNGLIAGALPYVVNALYFAVSGKVFSSSFSDIRDETPQKASLRTKLAFAFVSILMVFTFLSIPISPAHAEAAKVSKRVRHSAGLIFSDSSKFAKKELSSVSQVSHTVGKKPNPSPSP